ncbi:MAG: molybdopterin-dependent oxidoreductase [Dehalococcoidia bacterium]|nr:molybdopterin-dependent oxidoreductase [Dehalococcoidia bacterium]
MATYPTLKAKYQVGQWKNRDKHTEQILTGTFPYYPDMLAGKKLFAAIKTSKYAKGRVAMKETDRGVDSIAVNLGGTGYVSTPTVVITGGGGSGATARAFIHNGMVVQVYMLNRGSGYTSAPSVRFDGGGGSGATATAAVAAEEPVIDISKALAVPGVRGVYTYKDLGLWSNEIWYFGSPLAAVVAEDWGTAQYACHLIDIDEIESPSSTDPWLSLNPNSPVATRTGDTNLRAYGAWSYRINDTWEDGDDFDAEYRKCTATAELDLDFSTGYQHNMLEPHGQTAWWVGDDVYVWSGNQNLHSGYEGILSSPAIARSTTGSLANPLATKIHYYSHGTGGACGDKGGASTSVCAIKLSLFNGGAPVCLVQSRPVNMTINTRQAGTAVKVRAGTSGTGNNAKVSCLEIQATTVQGVSGGTASGSAAGWTGSDGSFTIPNYRRRVRNLTTTKPAHGPYRCVGDPPATYGYDPVIDMLAEQVGTNPYRLRMNMARKTGDNTETTAPSAPSGVSFISRAAYRSLDLPAMFEKVATESNFVEKWHDAGKGTERADGKKHGIAIAGHVDGHGSSDGSSRWGIITLYYNSGDVRARCYVAGPRGGVGGATAMCNITAEVLGLPYENVMLEMGNAETTKAGGMQSGSQFTSGCGSAFYNAAYKGRLEMMAVAIENAAFTGNNAPPMPSDRKLATATAIVTDGRITGFTITDSGDGYTGTPRVTITGGGGSGASATAIVVAGKVASIGVTNPGSGYTGNVTVTIGWLSSGDLDAANGYIFLASNPSWTTTTNRVAIATLLNNATNLSRISCAWQARGWSQSNGNGSACTVTEVLVDPGTGMVDITGMWNIVDTGGTLYKRGTIKELLAGCEVIVTTTMYYGDIYDPDSGVMLSDYFTECLIPTSLDVGDTTNYHVYDFESPAGQGVFGAHGIGEPTCTNVTSLYCAIYNAIKKWPDREYGAVTPDRVLNKLYDLYSKPAID